MFCWITENWRGCPVVSREAVVELIANTTTREGLSIKAELDDSRYPTAVKVSDAELAGVRIRRSGFHGNWNHRIWVPKVTVQQLLPGAACGSSSPALRRKRPSAPHDSQRKCGSSPKEWSSRRNSSRHGLGQRSAISGVYVRGVATEIHERLGGFHGRKAMLNKVAAAPRPSARGKPARRIAAKSW